MQTRLAWLRTFLTCEIMIGVVVILAALLLFVVRVMRPAARTAVGQAVYYTPARLLLQGELRDNLYDERWLGDQIERDAGAGVRDVFTATPPSAVLLMTPIAWLSYESARILWAMFNGACFVFALAILARTSASRLQAWMIALLVATLLLSAPVAANFEGQQVYALLLLLHVVAWHALRRGDERVAGVALGLAIGFKLSGWMIALLLLMRRRGRIVGWIALIGIALFCISGLLIGWETWHQYIFVEAPTMMGWPAAPLTAYQTTTGFFQHLLRFDAVWNPYPIMDAPALATALNWAVALCALWLTMRVRDLSMLFASGLVLSELLSPLAEDYHFMLFALPLFVMWMAVASERRASAWLIASTATALIVLSIRFQQPEWTQGWLALLAYPRLYGGWLVWGMIVFYAAKRTYAQPASS